MNEETAREALTINEKIVHAISIKTLFTIDLFGLSIPITDTIVWSWGIMAFLVIASILATRRLREIPGRGQALLEWIIDFLYSFVEENLGHHGKAFASFIGSLALFILTANLLPLISPTGGFGHEPPFIIRPLTRDINVTAGLAVAVMIVVLVSTFRYKGLKGFAKSLVSPLPFMLPFNLMEYIIKPVSLSLRLFGNILGAFIIMQLIEAVMPVLAPPLAGLYFDLFDGLIQAVVFTFLSTIYIAEAIHQEES